MKTNIRSMTPSYTLTPSQSHIEIIASSSTNIYVGAYPPRDSASTLVGDLPRPGSLKAKSPSSISSQRTPSRETPDPPPRYPVTPTISARKKPMCKTCGTPRKGHKRGTCTPSPAPPDECKSLYVTSPEHERTPMKTSVLAKAWATGPTQSSSMVSAISSNGKRRPIHGICGLPMKGHKRQNGILVCPSDYNQDTSTMSALNIKPPESMDQKLDYSLDSPHLVRPVGRSTTPTSASGCVADRFQSESPNPFMFNDPLYNSISTFAPSIASDSQSTAVMPSISALTNALGEPAVVIYPAWSREEVSQIREQAKAHHFFNGVVNVKIDEGDGLDLTRAIRKGDTDDQGSSLHYMKWVIVSGKKEMVEKCISLCAERSPEL